LFSRKNIKRSKNANFIVEYDKNDKEKCFNQSLDSMINNGAVVLQNYFCEQELSKLEKEYNNYLKKLQKNILGELSQVLHLSNIFCEA